MDRKIWSLCLLLIGIGGWYAYQFTDWFAKKAIQVSVSFRPLRQANVSDALPVVLSFDQDYVLSALSVTEMNPEATNAPGRVVWQLERQGKGGNPTRGFLYGDAPEGMKPAAGKGAAEPLKAGAFYRVAVAAGKVAGTTEFQARSPE
jgi:hypothetical protein